MTTSRNVDGERLGEPPFNSGRDHSSPTLATIEIPADFDRPLTFTITPNRPEPEREALPPNPAEPQAEIGQ